MRDRLPVHIENREMPKDISVDNDRDSYGYVNILYLTSIIITIASILTIVFLEK
ncbi:MAG: hypothetical protein IJE89_03290 [Bacilli bacterium]|nr:hypothetical protein [Bacilli bacterium]